MPHDVTALDNWHHEIVNNVSLAANYNRCAIMFLEEGNVAESKVLLEKSLNYHSKIMSMLREDYIERKRMET